MPGLELLCCFCGGQRKKEEREGGEDAHSPQQAQQAQQPVIPVDAAAENDCELDDSTNKSLTPSGEFQLDARFIEASSLLSGIRQSITESNPSYQSHRNHPFSQSLVSHTSRNVTIQLDSPGKRWLSSFCRCDPRWQINAFFLLAAQQGAALDHVHDAILRAFSKARVFTVWRPCSREAISKMIKGQGVGKGLEIKGKSARQGQLSGFVPYLQIHTSKDKRFVGTVPPDQTVRVFFKDQASRNQVYDVLKPALKEMMQAARNAKRTLRKMDVKAKLEEELLAAQQQKDNDQTTTTTQQSMDGSSSSRSDGRSLEKSSPGRRKSSRLIRRPKKSKSNDGGLDNNNNNSNGQRRPSRREKFHDKRSRSLTFLGLRKHYTAEEVEAKQQDALEKLMWNMTSPKLIPLDDYAPRSIYGLQVPIRLLWKVLVCDQAIERDGELETGRPSEPFFQDMNHKALYNNNTPTSTSNGNGKEKAPDIKDDDEEGPSVVLWQTASVTENNGNSNNPLDARTLVMAYEEFGRVLPVVSDFDCFLMGTRGVRYPDPLPTDQSELLEWCVEKTTQVLEEQTGGDDTSTSWTSRWLEVLKASAVKGFHPTIPRFGFGDNKSNEMMKGAVGRSVQVNGAVRHGAECFNYYFPQEIDKEFLVVSDMLPNNIPWKYVTLPELQEFLHSMVDQGFTFPMNPKWILCDPGWKPIYDRLAKSTAPDVQDSLSIWYPPKIRQSFETVCAQYPNGYVYTGGDQDACGTEAMDLATLQLNRYLTLQRAKRKLRAVMLFQKLGRMAKTKNGGSNQQQNGVTNNHKNNNGKEEDSDNGCYFMDPNEFEVSMTDFYSAREEDDTFISEAKR